MNLSWTKTVTITSMLNMKITYMEGCKHILQGCNCLVENITFFRLSKQNQVHWYINTLSKLSYLFCLTCWFYIMQLPKFIRKMCGCCILWSVCGSFVIKRRTQNRIFVGMYDKRKKYKLQIHDFVKTILIKNNHFHTSALMLSLQGIQYSYSLFLQM